MWSLLSTRSATATTTSSFAQSTAFSLASVGFRFDWTGRDNALRGVRKLLTRETQLQPLVLVSHHFMSRDEIESDAGRERLAHCVFRVPMNGRLVSMCEVNAMGLREQYYGQLATASGATGAGRP